MKKVWITLLLLAVMILPTHVFADEVKSENLDEILTSKSITHDFSNYSENDDQAIVYLFYGLILMIITLIILFIYDKRKNSYYFKYKCINGENS